MACMISVLSFESLCLRQMIATRLGKSESLSCVGVPSATGLNILTANAWRRVVGGGARCTWTTKVTKMMAHIPVIFGMNGMKANCWVLWGSRYTSLALRWPRIDDVIDQPVVNGA